MHDLLRDLNNENSHVRQEAMRKARHLSSEGMIELLEQEANSFRDARRIHISQGIPQTITSLALGVSFFFVFGRMFSLFFVYAVIGVLLLILYRMIRASFLHSPARQCLAYLLAESHDPLLAPYALDLYHNASSTEVRRETRVALRNMLPHLEHTDDWTMAQKQNLLQLIQLPATDNDLVFCALKALAKVGDESALLVVRGLAAKKSVLYSSYVTYQRVRHANVQELEALLEAHERFVLLRREAQDCLQQIEARLAERNLEQTLLRPSDANSIASPETLLRAASAGVDPTASEQLLRPGIE